MGRQGGARRQVGGAEIVGHGPDDDRPRPEAVGDDLGRLVRLVDPAQHHDEPVALGGAQSVHAGRAGVAAYLVEDVGLGTPRRHRAQHDGHRAPACPAERARPGEHAPRRARSGAPSRRPGPRGGRPTPRGPRRRGRRPRPWRRRPRGRRAARRRGRRRDPRARGTRRRATPPRRCSSRIRADRLLEADHARQRAGCGAEDGRGQRRAGGQAGLSGAEPVDEPPDAGLHDQADPRALLGGELAEPGHVLLHAGHRRGAQRAGGPLQRVGRSAPTRVVGVAGAERGGRHTSSVVKGRAATRLVRKG